MLDQFIQDTASDANVPDRVAALRAIVALLVRVKDQTVRELYAGQLPGILRMEPQQVRRAMQEAVAAAQKQARAYEPAHTSGAQGQGTPTGAQAPASAATSGPATRLPAEELELLVMLANYPELLRSSEAARAGDLLVHPLARQLYRAAAEQAAQGDGGTLDIPAWLETMPVADRATIAAALGSERFAGIADPAGYLRKLVIRLEILRVNAEIAMTTRLQREAQERGTQDAANAHSVRGIELRKTKEGLLAALQRP
jgi:hypothetical protein